MGRICHGVVCLSRSFVDVRACFEWTVSAMKLYACLVPSHIIKICLHCEKFMIMPDYDSCTLSIDNAGQPGCPDIQVVSEQ